MLLSLNYINETMYYWGVNSKMQTSHTLCSRPKRYGALQQAHTEANIAELVYGISFEIPQQNRINEASGYIYTYIGRERLVSLYLLF